MKGALDDAVFPGDRAPITSSEARHRLSVGQSLLAAECGCYDCRIRIAARADYVRKAEQHNARHFAAPFIIASLHRLDATAANSEQRRAYWRQRETLRSEYPDIFARE